MTHRSRLFLAALLTAGAALTTAVPAAAQDTDEPTPTTPQTSIMVVEAQGLTDPVTTDLVLRSLDEAEDEQVALFVLAVDSPGALDTDPDRIVRALTAARVPVVVWVGGSDAEARGAAVDFLLAGHVAAAARGARIGPGVPRMLSDGSVSEAERQAVARRLKALAELRGRDADVAASLALEERTLSGAEAEEAGLVDLTAPTLRDLVAVLDGREVEVAGRTVTLALGEVVDGDGRAKQVLPIRFRQFTLGEQTVHALTSPFVAYLLLVLGLCLVVFEFFAIGIGLAAAAGVFLVGASFVGLSHLPVSGVGLGLLLAGFVGLSISVQSGRAGAWGVIGSALLLAGSLTFYSGADRLDPPWWQVVLVVGGALLFLLPGLAAVVRARFSTPTVGRESMVGEIGVAAAAIDPEGVVDVRGALWRARATRASHIQPGDQVKVAAILGLTLEVEPLDDDDGDETDAAGGADGGADGAA